MEHSLLSKVRNLMLSTTRYKQKRCGFYTSYITKVYKPSRQVNKVKHLRFKKVCVVV